MYLYTTTIFKETQKVVGLDPNNESNRADFEANKSSAVLVNGIIPPVPIFLVEKNYTDFKAFINGALITWADVKYTSDNEKYVLNLIADLPL